MCVDDDRGLCRPEGPRGINAVDLTRLGGEDVGGPKQRQDQQSVLQARVKLVERADPAVERPVVAQANLDVNGRLVRAQVEGVTARSGRSARGPAAAPAGTGRRTLGSAARQATCGRPARVAPRVRAHASAVVLPRPEDERQIIRRESFTLPTSTVDEAALQMDLLDADFTCSPRRARTPTVSSTVPDRRVTVWHK